MHDHDHDRSPTRGFQWLGMPYSSLSLPPSYSFAFNDGWYTIMTTNVFSQPTLTIKVCYSTTCFSYHGIKYLTILKSQRWNGILGWIALTWHGHWSMCSGWRQHNDKFLFLSVTPSFHEKHQLLLAHLAKPHIKLSKQARAWCLLILNRTKVQYFDLKWV